MRTAYANLLLPRALAVVVLAFFSLATLSLANKAQAQEYSVGFLEIPASGDKPKNTPPILVWYPSTTPAEAGKLGPYEVTWAQNGAIAEGAHPVVLFSHGVNGRARRHRVTGEALAKAGFIMVAPWHRHDRGIINDVTRVEVRMRELAEALEGVSAHPVLGGSADFTRLGGLGFSFGAVPLLGVHGITLDLTTARAHCDKHADLDPRFCNYGNFIVRFLRRWDSDREVVVPPLVAPIKALTLMMPVAQAYRYSDFANQETPLFLVRGGADEVLPYPFHAESIHQAWQAPHTYRVFDTAHHNAFISPIPQWYAEQEEIGSAARDPEGFDRPAFLREANHAIADYFNEALK